jgi:RNA polymerase sigma-70 factor, ECF subfamily
MSLDETQNAFALLKRIQKQDQRAIEELRLFMGKRIYCFALNRLHDEYEADMIVSDTMFAVWTKPQGYKGNSRLSTWVYGIAKNKIRTLQRNKQAPDDDLEDYKETLASEGLGPFEILQQKESQAQIVACIDTLPTEQAECLVLTFYEGWTYLEIAEFQNVPEGTIKSRSSIARKAMKNCLERAAKGLRLINVNKNLWRRKAP